MLDGIVCFVNHPSANIQEACYLDKHKQHGVKYEISVDPETGFLVWVGGPIYIAMHDMRLMYLAAILQHLFFDEFILADKGYIGEWNTITPFRVPFTEEEKQVSMLLSAYRWIVEHVLARFKVFGCLSAVAPHS